MLYKDMKYSMIHWLIRVVVKVKIYIKDIP
jgi:hypothetical protein